MCKKKYFKREILTITTVFLSVLTSHCLVGEIDSDSAFHVFSNKINLAGDNQLPKALAHYEYGIYLDENGLIEKAIPQLAKAFQIVLTLNNDSLITKIGNYLGSVYWIEGDCTTSTRYYEAALQSALCVNDSNMIAVVKMNLSGNYSSSGQNERAITFAIEALEIKERTNNIAGICYDYIMVAEIFQSVDNTEKWKDYVHKAYVLKDQKQCAIMSDIVMIYNNLGRIADLEDEYDKALAYYDTIVQVSRPNNYAQGIGIALLNSALILQKQKKLGEALSFVEQSEHYFGQIPYFLMALANTKAQILQELEQYPDALALVNENILFNEMPLYPDIKQNCLSLLYELNFSLKNYQKAFQWNDSLRSHENTMRDDEKLKSIEEVETKYQTEKKEQQIELLSTANELKNQRIKTFIALTIALLLTISIIVAIYLLRQRKARLREDELKQKLLRSQMNPHFLFNALGSIQSYMLNNETKKAAGYLGNFASLTRSILEKSSEELIPLEDEINMLRNYIELERMRMNKAFSYFIDVDEALETEFIAVPPMMVQPFVENAMKHGLKDVKENTKLTVSITETSSHIVFTVEDNGVGFSKAQKAKTSNHRSMSMQIFEDRKEIFEKRMKKKIDLTIEDLEITTTKNSGTRIRIYFPKFDMA